MEQKILQFMEHYGSAFIVGTHPPSSLSYYNKSASALFGIEGSLDLELFQRIFEKSELNLKEALDNELFQREYAIFEHVLLRKADGTDLLCQVTAGFFDQEHREVFVEITPYQNNLMALTRHLMNQSLRPEAILKWDKELTLLHCNQPFYQLFGASRESCMAKYHHKMGNTFALEKKERLQDEIGDALARNDTYYTEVEVVSLTGGKKWVGFQLQKRVIDDSEVKIFCFANNVDEKVRAKEEVSLLNQYLAVVQESTVDLLYRVDIAKNTIYHYSDFLSVQGEDKVISDYVNVFFERNTVHPQDKEAYLESYRLFYEEDVISETPVRFSLGGRPYQWYKITGKKIYDSHGELKEVFGALVNVQEKHEIAREMEQVNQYFTAMLELSNDILFRIEMDGLVLHHKVHSSQTLMQQSEIPNYLEQFVKNNIVHPEDLQRYLQEVERFHQGKLQCMTVRFAIKNEEYQWYRVLGKTIFNKNGEIQEIWGRLVSIQDTEVVKEELSTLNQFFTAMQEMDQDVVFRIDLATMTLYFRKQIAPNQWEKVEIPDFFNTFHRENQVHPDDRERYFRLAGAYFDGRILDSDFHCEVRFALVTEHYVWYDIKCRKIYDKDGIATEVYGKLLNIDTEKAMSRGYSQLNQYFTAMQSLTSNHLFHIEVKTMTFIHSDKNINRLGFGLEISNFVETFIKKAVIRPEDAEIYRENTQKFIAGEQMEYQIQLAVDTDVYEWFHIKGQFIFDERGESSEIFGTMQNIQRQKDLENKANYDGLTETRNIKSFEAEVRRELENPETSSHHALVFLDMDDFKLVNDSYGHQFGDFVLETFAKRLKNCVRDTDIIGRLGGDEFVVYLKGVFHEDMALERANTMLDRLKPAIGNGKYSHVQGASIGIALIPEGGCSYQELYERADKAVYHSKKIGKNVVTIYNSGM